MPFVALFILSKKEGEEVIFDFKRVNSRLGKNRYLVYEKSNFDLKKLIFDLRKILFST